jgi:GT2 family glycosyltransferase
MTPTHRAWLASTEWLNQSDQSEMVGANMAFRSSVLNRVPAFDPELGPGASGFGDDSLFSWQLVEAGFRLVKRLDVAVVHHFDPSRLSRSSFLDQAASRGRTRAYLAHHWEHEVIRAPRASQFKRSMRLAQQRSIPRNRWRYAEGMPDWEMALVRDIHFYRRYLSERTRERCYAKRGLVKKCAE